MKKIELVLQKVKETKGTYVYGDSKEDAPIPSVYIKKTAFEGNAPKTLKLTLQEGE